MLPVPVLEVGQGRDEARSGTIVVVLQYDTSTYIHHIPT